jgi:hypothetical protein
LLFFSLSLSLHLWYRFTARPAQLHPDLVSKDSFLGVYAYFLPSIITAVFTSIGWVCGYFFLPETLNRHYTTVSDGMDSETSMELSLFDEEEDTHAGSVEMRELRVRHPGENELDAEELDRASNDEIYVFDLGEDSRLDRGARSTSQRPAWLKVGSVSVGVSGCECMDA